MRVMLWLLCGDFQYGSSFDPHCTLFSYYRPVYCRSCFYEHKCHRAPARVQKVSASVIFVHYWEESSFHTSFSLILVLVKFGGFR